MTHVQLLPVQDFENDEASTNYNWGYVTSDYNTPEGWYATNINDASRIRELKQLIAALHERGIGVILDVVYNHTANSASFNTLVPHYYYRYQPDGRLYNSSGCGNDFRSEAPMARKYILDTLKYWTQEYGVDGYRFDIMSLIDLDTMKEVDRELHAINPHIVLYGEAWGNKVPAPLKSTNKENVRGTHLGGFNDNIRDAFIGSQFDKNKGAFIQSGSGIEKVEHGIKGELARVGADTRTGHQFSELPRQPGRLGQAQALQARRDRGGDERHAEAGLLPVAHVARGAVYARGRRIRPHEIWQRQQLQRVGSHQRGRLVIEEEKLRSLHLHARPDRLAQGAPGLRLRAKEQIAAWLKFHDTNIPGTVMYTLDPGSLPGGELEARLCDCEQRRHHEF